MFITFMLDVFDDIFICEFFAGTFILFLKKTRKMKEIYNRLEESKEMRPCGLTLTAKWITWIESDSKEPRRIGMRLYQFSLTGGHLRVYKDH